MERNVSLYSLTHSLNVIFKLHSLTQNVWIRLQEYYDFIAPHFTIEMASAHDQY